jgi:translation initiation factor 4G
VLYRKFRSHLNKLTPENYEKIVEKVALLVIDTEERLSGCIDIIFEKVLVTFEFESYLAEKSSRKVYYIVVQ